jgi:hypothetical protein
MFIGRPSLAKKPAHYKEAEPSSQADDHTWFSDFSAF